jgi:CheY-like chemotaxis protein
MSLCILLVDDDEMMLESGTWTLEDLGHRVETASSGQEALDRLTGGLEADLVLLDQNMPGLTGIETLVRLRASHPNLPVLLASGYLDGEAQAALKEAPPSAVLPKPFGIADFKAAIAGLMKGDLG